MSSKSEKKDPLKRHREFVKHIQELTGVKGGPQLQVFAKMYKDLAKAKLPNASSDEQTDEAQKIFDAETKENRNKKYEKAGVELAKKKQEKKKEVKEGGAKKVNKKSFKKSEEVKENSTKKESSTKKVNKKSSKKTSN